MKILSRSKSIKWGFGWVKYLADDEEGGFIHTIGFVCFKRLVILFALATNRWYEHDTKKIIKVRISRHELIVWKLALRLPKRKKNKQTQLGEGETPC